MSFLTSLLLVIWPQTSVTTCDATVMSFYQAQLSYEQASTEDELDNVAAEIEAQYECEINEANSN